MEEDAGTSGLSTLTVAKTLATQGLSSRVPETGGTAAPAAAGDGGSPVSRRWPIAIAAVLLVLAGCACAVGYLAMQAHRKSEAITAATDAALIAAKDCVVATQPPNAAALPASRQRLGECSTGDFGEQAVWYGEVLTEAYRAVDVRVGVPAMHAAVERYNEDGSIVALVVFRATVSQTGMADRENSYRVRVTMVPDNGQFKVAELEQVAK